jgi:hypothetical protein
MATGIDIDAGCGQLKADLLRKQLKSEGIKENQTIDISDVSKSV